MGYHTDLYGEATVTPPLSADERAYLVKFNDTRRMNRSKGPFFVDGSGFHGQGADDDVVDYNLPPEGQPGLWCPWTPSEDGTAITWDEGEKPYDIVEWMEYLIDTFLAPDAEVKRIRAAGDPDGLLAGVPEFADHVLNGQIDAQGEDPDDRWRLVVTDNVVKQQHPEVVWPE